MPNCPDCDKYFFDFARDELRAHIGSPECLEQITRSRSQINADEMMCLNCGAMLARYNTDHLGSRECLERVSRLRNSPIACSVCHRQFETARECNDHETTHTFGEAREAIGDREAQGAEATAREAMNPVEVNLRNMSAEQFNQIRQLLDAGVITREQAERLVNPIVVGQRTAEQYSGNIIVNRAELTSEEAGRLREEWSRPGRIVAGPIDEVRVYQGIGIEPSRLTITDPAGVHRVDLHPSYTSFRWSDYRHDLESSSIHRRYEASGSTPDGSNIPWLNFYESEISLTRWREAQRGDVGHYPPSRIRVRIAGADYASADIPQFEVFTVRPIVAPQVEPQNYGLGPVGTWARGRSLERVEPSTSIRYVIADPSGTHPVQLDSYSHIRYQDRIDFTVASGPVCARRYMVRAGTDEWTTILETSFNLSAAAPSSLMINGTAYPLTHAEPYQFAAVGRVPDQLKQDEQKVFSQYKFFDYPNAQVDKIMRVYVGRNSDPGTWEDVASYEYRADSDFRTWKCHDKPRRYWCDREGKGGFMGHTCQPKEKPNPEFNREFSIRHPRKVGL